MDLSATQETIYVDNRLHFDVKSRDPITTNASKPMDRFSVGSYLNESNEGQSLVDFPEEYEVIIICFIALILFPLLKKR